MAKLGMGPASSSVMSATTLVQQELDQNSEEMKAAKLYKLMGVGLAFIMVYVWVTSYSHHTNGPYDAMTKQLKKIRTLVFEKVHGNVCDGDASLMDMYAKYITAPENTFAAIWVEGNGDFPERLNDLITVVENVRNTWLEQAAHCNWMAPGNITTILDGRKLTYLRDVSETAHFVQVMLSWVRSKNEEKVNNNKNLLVQKYYQWIASPKLCGWIKGGVTNHRWNVVYNTKCETNTSDALDPIDLAVTYLNARPALKHLFPVKYPSYFYTQPPKHVTYLMVAVNAVFTLFGDMYTNNVKLVPFGCSSDVKIDLSNDIKKAPLYDEVFTISQYWGKAFFHKNVEDYPRLAAFLPFLLLNKSIKLHVFETGGYTAKVLNLLGITSDRLVNGVVRAKIAYMPEATYCGFAHPANSQLLSKIYRNTLHNTKEDFKRNSVVLIRRSGRRKFTQHSQIKQMVQTISQQYNLAFREFTDNPPPTLEETMKIFNRAVMVIGPHGAGLSNIIFSEPGTFVIEGVCNPPHINMCFNRLAHVLGHHWHGIESRGGCEGVVDVHTLDMEQIVNIYIQNAAKLAMK